jgi:hypothetical protein
MMTAADDPSDGETISSSDSTSLNEEYDETLLSYEDLDEPVSTRNMTRHFYHMKIWMKIQISKVAPQQESQVGTSPVAVSLKEMRESLVRIIPVAMLL